MRPEARRRRKRRPQRTPPTHPRPSAPPGCSDMAPNTTDRGDEPPRASTPSNADDTAGTSAPVGPPTERGQVTDFKPAALPPPPGPTGALGPAVSSALEVVDARGASSPR